MFEMTDDEQDEEDEEIGSLVGAGEGVQQAGIVLIVVIVVCVGAENFSYFFFSSFKSIHLCTYTY